MSKKIILGIMVVAVIIGGLGYKFYTQEDGAVFTLAEVSRGDILQEVLETGTVVPSEKIELQFESSGKIKSILVKEGDKVVAGQNLIKLENDELYIQKQQAQATLDLAQARLDQLMAGESDEQIKVYQTAMENAEKTVVDAKIALANAIQNLENTRNTAETNLAQAYQSSLNTLDDAYLKMYNALNTVDLIQRTYFDSNDQASIRTKESEQKIEDAVERVEACVGVARQSLASQDIDFCSAETNSSLNEVNSNLISVRNTMEEPIYRNVVSSTDKTSLDNQRTYINIEITENISDQQNIASKKLTNQTSINTAQISLDTAQASLNTYQGQLATAQDNLALAKAEPRQTDIALHQAQIKEAKASLSLIQKQITEAILKAPIEGQITKVNKKPGELAQPTDVVVVFLPSVPFEIETNIYEEDIVKINIGNPVDISLIAFPGQVFKGKVVSIDPAEKVIEGVVYYEITITFERIPKEVKPGMTADLAIKTAQKENVLKITEEAVQKKDGKIFVEVLKDGEIEEREIETGILGSDDMIEVISGLKAGEKIILR